MLNDDAFARLVAEDVKNKTTKEQHDYLRLPENQGRWRDNLAALISNLHDQVAEIEKQRDTEKARLKGLGRGKAGRAATEAGLMFEDRVKKIERFGFYVEQTLAEADRLIALGEEGLDEDLRLAAFLSKAINTHRDMMHEHDLEATDIDRALWAALEGKWDFGRVTEDSLP